MALPTLNKQLPKKETRELIQNQDLRSSVRWKFAHEKFIDLLGTVFKGRDAEEKYKKYIDKIVSGERTSQKNSKSIITGWNKFKPDDYDSYFKEKVEEFGSEEAYYKWLDDERMRIQKERELSEMTNED